MKRRHLLRAAAQGLLLGASTGVWATPERTRAFNAGLERHPWLLGFKGVERAYLTADAKITGTFPAELTGTLYRNGPARHNIGDFRYSHWFDGDGMVQAFQIADGKVRHRGRLVATKKLQAELAAGRALYPGFASVPENPAAVTSPDLVNVANISVLPHHDRLYALWEAGSPWEIDADTLEAIGPAEFSPATAGVPFSAHPRIEPDGTLWNFGYVSSAGLFALWHIDPKGRVVKAGTVPVAPMTMPHDFVVTAKHLILLLPPLNYRRGQAATFLDAHEWDADAPTRVLVIDKNDFEQRRWFELPAQWVFHFGNAWEDRQGVIRFDGASAADPNTMFASFREVMRGQIPAPTPSAHLAYRIDLRNGRASQRPLFATGMDSEFPTIDPRRSTLRNERLTLLSNAGATAAAPRHRMLSSVSRYDYTRERLQTYRYPSGQIPEEHLFVPAPGKSGEDEGWLIGTALDFDAGTTLLNLFDARSIESGPIATARLPYALPLGFHGKFLA